MPTFFRFYSFEQVIILLNLKNVDNKNYECNINWYDSRDIYVKWYKQKQQIL